MLKIKNHKLNEGELSPEEQLGKALYHMRNILSKVEADDEDD